MGLGLLILVSVGKENIYLSAQPEITFFKMAYRRHTNFSSEPTPQYFKTTPDFGRRCTVNVGKNADLMGQSYLYVELPSIQFENIISSLNVKKFAWVKKIGLALINYIEFEVGGTIIDRHYGDWINIWIEMTTSMGLNKSVQHMIGDTHDLTGLSQSKSSRILYIPLYFWFCQDTGLALPLIALAHNDIKIHVDFNNIDVCYKLSPAYFMTVNNSFCLYKPGEKIYQVYQNNKILGEFVYFDSINQKLYYNAIKGKFIVPTTNNDPKLKIVGETSGFESHLKVESVVVKDTDYFKFNKPSLINAYIVVNYIYLDNFERANFLNNSHEYLIQVVQTLPEQVMYSLNVTYKLPLYNPVKLLVWRAILTSNQNSNDQFNYTTFPYTDEEEYLINKNLIVINSVNRMELDTEEFYTNIPKYQYNISNRQKGIYMYSFAVNPLDLQPSGSMNFSKVDDAYIQMKMNKITNYQNPVAVKGYAVQYNLLRISNGIGGLVFNV
jgi:hypothetical protein